MKTLILLATCALIFTGCTKYVYYWKTDPPEITFDKLPKKIAFVNQYDYISTPHVKGKPAIAYKTGIHEFGKTLSASTDNNGNLAFLFADTLYKYGDTIHDMPIDTVRAMCKLYNSAHLAVLDKYEVDLDYEIETTTNDKGRDVRNAIYYVRSHHYVSLYDSAGGLIKRTDLGKSIEYASRPVVLLFVPLFGPSNLGKATEEIRKLARQAASQYRAMFYPNTYKTGRQLNTGKVFAESNSLISQKKYDEAIDRLKKICQTASPDTKRKATQNLEVAEELKENDHSQNPIIPL